MSSSDYRLIEVEPIAGALGAEVRGVDIAPALDDDVIDEIRRAFLEHLVIFFRNQDLKPSQLLAFAQHFGEPMAYPQLKGLPECPLVTPVGFIFAYVGVLILLGMFVDGVAMVLLTVPVVFPIALALKIDPVHLAIIVTLAVETGVVTPPVGLNVFAVSGTSKIPVIEVTKGTIPFFLGDLAVLVLVVFYPALALWLPDLLVIDVFK